MNTLSSPMPLVKRPAITWARAALLVCGIAASLLYVAMNILAPLHFPGYDVSSQTVSEFSAIDAPSRAFWVPLGYAYTLLMVAFAVGVWTSAGQNKALRKVGALMLVYSAVSLYWPPMHLRPALAAGQGTLTDTLHIVWAVVTVALMVLAMGYGASAFGSRFRIYSIASLVILLSFGFLSGQQAPSLSKNLPTPLLGVYERINIGMFLLWVIVLAIAMLRRPGK